MVDQRKLHEESNRFGDSGDSHDLPEIANWFHENILSPELFKHTGSKSFQDLVLQGIKESRKSNEEFVLVSLGAGHGQIETDLLRKVPYLSPGKTHFYAIDLFSPNDTVERNIDGEIYRLTRISQDLNKPMFPKNANMIIVHHALHHFVELEEIFKSIHEILHDNSGTLVIADMVGRNGHMRWLESFRAINRIWKALPEEKHFNNQLQRAWQNFENWDCSSEGFEGIRSEDIIKPLFEYFESKGSFFWGGILDPFIDRGFGDNFDSTSEKDIKIIRDIISIENKMKDSGYLTATQVIGTFSPRNSILPSSFTNHLISKKFYSTLAPEVKIDIDNIVDGFFKVPAERIQRIQVSDEFTSRNLTPYILNGWDVFDPSILWGVGLESRLRFSPSEESLSGIEIECYVLDRAKFGQIHILINDEIEIRQQLSPYSFIHLPPIPLLKIEISFHFLKLMMQRKFWISA